MNDILNFILAILTPIAIALAITCTGRYIWHKKIKRSEKKHKFELIVFAWLFVGILLFLPMTYDADSSRLSVVGAIYYPIQIMTFQITPQDFASAIETFSAPSCRWILWLFYFLMPLLFGGVILNMIKGLIPQLKISLSSRKNFCVFTELNANSLNLANSIEGKKIIFIGKRDADTTLVEEADRRGYIQADLTVADIFLKAKKEISIFFIDNDESKALDKMIDFIEGVDEQYKAGMKKKTDIAIYLFSVSDDAEMIVDSYKKRYEDIIGSLRLIDTAQLISYKTLRDIPLYSAPDSRNNGFNVTVIGMGNIGTHVAKDVLWCGQMNNVPLKLNIVDKLPVKETRGRFESKYPELTPENYDINYYSADTRTSCFDEELRNELSASNYIVVALGDDIENIVTANDIRMKYYRYHRKFPVIVAIVRSSSKNKAVINVFGAETEQDINLHIHRSGMRNSIFTTGEVENGSLYNDALKVRNTYDKLDKDKSEREHIDMKLKDFFNISESEIRSNIASAIHINYKLWNFSGTTDDEKALAKFRTFVPEDYRKDEETEEWRALNKLEHRRWMAFGRSEGMVSAFDKDDLTDEKFPEAAQRLIDDYKAAAKKYEKNEDNHKILFAKIHGCIIDDEKYLIELGKIAVKDKDRFIINDKRMNRLIIDILEKRIQQEK